MFANIELDVVLRAVLRCVTIGTIDAAERKWHREGVAFVPEDEGRVVVHHRPPALLPLKSLR